MVSKLRIICKQKRNSLEVAFRRADADDSGGISKMELVDCMRGLGYQFSAGRRRIDHACAHKICSSISVMHGYAEEVLAMADAADTVKRVLNMYVNLSHAWFLNDRLYQDGDGTIDIHEFSIFIDQKFKDEFRTYKAPPQVEE